MRYFLLLAIIYTALLSSCYDRCAIEQEYCLVKCKTIKDTNWYEDCTENCQDILIECWDAKRLRRGFK